MTGPFRKLIIKLILEKAIIFEERAYRFYESALSMVEHEQTADLLKRLSAAELEHRLKLEEIQKRGILETGDYEGTDFEKNGDYEMISREWPDIASGSSHKEILNVALAREKTAFRFYRNLKEYSRVKVAKELFGMLAREESNHISWITREIDRIKK
jgi:rubrerythrin